VPLSSCAAYYYLGNALNSKKQLDEAIAAYKMAIDIDSKHADAYVSLGNALTAKNRIDDAIAAYKKAIDIEPGSAIAYYNLGSALQSNKQEIHRRQSEIRAGLL
jgi:superkiller protein 3